MKVVTGDQQEARRALTGLTGGVRAPSGENLGEPEAREVTRIEGDRHRGLRAGWACPEGCVDEFQDEGATAYSPVDRGRYVRFGPEAAHVGISPAILWPTVSSRSSPHPISCPIRARGLQRTLPDDQCYHFTAGLRGRSGQRRVRERTRPRPPTADGSRWDSLSRAPLRVDLTAAASRPLRSRTPPPARCSFAPDPVVGHRVDRFDAPSVWRRGGSARTHQHADRPEALDCRLDRRRVVIEGEVNGGEDLAVDGKVDGTIELPQRISDGPRGQSWSPAGRVVVCPSVSRARDSSSGGHLPGAGFTCDTCRTPLPRPSPTSSSTAWRMIAP